MKKKIFITGGGGMLASQLEQFYIKNQDEVLAPRHAELDVLDEEAIKEALYSFKPDCVFHTAALHVDACEDNPELAFKLNGWATGNLAKLCSELDSEFVYISSCGYFGDEIKYYPEVEPVVLKTVYARSKHEGEVLALKESKKTYAIRPGWLFGGNPQHKKNFVYQRYLDALKSPVIKSAKDKFGTPTFVGDLVLKIEQILKTKRYGLYHVTNSGGCSRAEYIAKIIESFGLNNEVIPVDSTNFPRKANVPACELLENRNIKLLGLSFLP
ncbi:MAG: NAD(P)-dependent oxidoreductase [Candidatus Omnitrophica bacterium]|nr:NAD(P)-dependent oxidoreductase [Candidatus Omnitrophota bacterium]